MTTGDWDFSTTHWLLDSSTYVSAPSSWAGKSTGACRVLIKTSVVPIADVKEGQLVTQLKMTQVMSAGIYSELWLIFRYQDAINFYYVQIVWDGSTFDWRVRRRKAGVDTDLGTKQNQTYPGTAWRHIRVTWWNDAVGLVIRVERYSAGAWELWMNDSYDADNEWADVGGRVGFMDVATTLKSCNIDDTQIWGVPS